jgi:hypothetical protein
MVWNRRFQVNVGETVERAVRREQEQAPANSPIIDGIMVEDITLWVGIPSVIAHHLGRQPIGWVLCDVTADAYVHRDAWDSRTITLDSDSDTTCAIWVF